MAEIFPIRRKTLSNQYSKAFGPKRGFSHIQSAAFLNKYYIEHEKRIESIF